MRSGPGEARTILLLHIISVRPSKQPLMVRTFLKVYMELGSYFVSARTNKTPVRSAQPQTQARRRRLSTLWSRSTLTPPTKGAASLGAAGQPCAWVWASDMSSQLRHISSSPVASSSCRSCQTGFARDTETGLC
jgi:hypothetical protein